MSWHSLLCGYVRVPETQRAWWRTAKAWNPVTDYALRWTPFATIHGNANFASCGRKAGCPIRIADALDHCVVLSYLIFIFIFAPFLFGFVSFFNFILWFLFILYFPFLLCEALPPYFPNSRYLFYFTFGAHKWSFF